MLEHLHLEVRLQQLLQLGEGQGDPVVRTMLFFAEERDADGVLGAAEQALDEAVGDQITLEPDDQGDQQRQPGSAVEPVAEAEAEQAEGDQDEILDFFVLIS